MRAALIQRVERPVDLDRLEVRDRTAGPIERVVDEANRRAVQSAKNRIALRLPKAAVDSLEDYFVAPAVYEWPAAVEARPRSSILSLLRELCSKVHSVAFNSKARGLQIGVLGGETTLDPKCFGDEAEPGSDLFVLSAEALLAAAKANASVEIRLFDRQIVSWADLADDLATVAGADIFMKAFVAGGHKSVNRWHRDTSDVLVTMLDGKKRFEVGTFDSPDHSPIDELDVTLAPGDALLLPRSRLHNVTPAGEVSALLSIGLMRYGDWSYRGATPSHLGLTNPRSVLQYRLALRPHVPASFTTVETTTVCQTRMPGGIGVIEQVGEKLRFVAAGKMFETTTDVLRCLSVIHGSGGTTVDEVAAQCGRSPVRCARLIRDLVAVGLVRA